MFKNKYLKYKNKYLNLKKNLYGGSNIQNLSNEQIFDKYKQEYLQDKTNDKYFGYIKGHGTTIDTFCMIPDNIIIIYLGKTGFPVNGNLFGRDLNSENPSSPCLNSMKKPVFSDALPLPSALYKNPNLFPGIGDSS